VVPRHRLDKRCRLLLDPPIVAAVWSGNCGFDLFWSRDAREATTEA
jgi:hypothetical protein